MDTQPNFVIAKLPLALTFSFLSLGFHVSSVMAESAVAETGVNNDVEHILVLGRTENTSIMDMAANVNIIDSSDIQLSGATNLTELLRGSYGIQISDNNTNAVISMRGFTSGQAANNTLILIDGRKLNNIDIAAPALSAIPLNMIERIEVLSGSAGVLYGDQAVGGVINIVTRAPDRDGGNLTLSGGSFDTREVRGDFAGRITDNWHYYFSGSQKNSDNYRDNNESQTGAILGRIGYKDNTTDFYAESSYFDNEIELPGRLTKEEFNQDPRQSIPRYHNDYLHDMTFAARSGISQIINNNWKFSTDVNYTDSLIDSYNTFSSGSGSSLRNERDLLMISPKFIGNYSVEQGDLNLVLGSDISRGHSRFSFGRSNTQTMYSAYVQATVPLNSQLSYVVGGRHSHVDNNLKDNFVYPNGIKLDNNANAFELGLNYQLDKNNRLYIRAEDNFRFAKVDEQANTASNIVGLKTQKGRSYEAGWNFNKKSLQTKLNIYLLKLKDEIIYNPDQFVNINADPSQRYGINTAIDWMVLSNVQIGAEYNYIDAEFTEGSNKGKQLTWIAKNIARAYASYDLTSNWQTYIDTTYTGRRYLENDNAHVSNKLPSYTLFNIAINYTYQDWLASLRIDNIFDKNYVSAGFYSTSTNGYYSGTGRDIRFTVNYQF